MLKGERKEVGRWESIYLLQMFLFAFISNQLQETNLQMRLIQLRPSHYAVHSKIWLLTARNWWSDDLLSNIQKCVLCLSSENEEIAR